MFKQKKIIIDENVISSYPPLVLEERNVLAKNMFTFKSDKSSLDEARNACNSYFTMKVDEEVIFGIINHILYDSVNYYLLYVLLDVEIDSNGLIIEVETEVKMLVNVKETLKTCVK